MDAIVNHMDVICTNPTPHGGEVIFQYQGRLYRMTLLWRDGGVDTTLASQLENDPLVVDETYQRAFLIALKRFMDAETNGEFVYYVKDPKEIFHRGIRPHSLERGEQSRIMFDFADMSYVLEGIHIIKTREGEWLFITDDATISHTNPDGTCQCGKTTGPCESMEAVSDWVWEAIEEWAKKRLG